MFLLDAYLLNFIRIALCLLFIVAFLNKVRNISVFIQTIADFRLLPKWLNKIVALIFLVSELLVVTLLCLGSSYLDVGLVLAIIILTTFTIALVSALTRRIQTSCNCFGPSKTRISRYEVWRNIVFIIFTLVALGIHWTRGDGYLSLSLVEVFLLVVTEVVFVIIIVNFQEIVHLFQQR